MSRYTKNRTVSPETQNEAMQVARATQRPGQTKEQTRLIAQGIQKGIDQYKKQHKAKARELDKRSKATHSKNTSAAEPEIHSEPRIVYKQHWLPWLLLILSWVAAAVFTLAGYR